MKNALKTNPDTARDASGLLEGSIRRELIWLALPLLFSNILQQFYNTADSLIIARYLGSDAFASTGISGSLMNLFLFVSSGFCVGISVILAQAYGNGDRSAFRQKFFLSLVTGSALTLLITAVSILLLNPLLRLIKTPDELLGYCRTYMIIILTGLLASYLYNFFASVLRAVGNTKVSLYFLVVSVAANVFLDVLLVAVLRMGIAGAALATVAAQLFSALGCLLYLRKMYPLLICRREDVCFRLPLFRQIMRFGMISALHQSSLYIGKIMVQGIVNTLGTGGIAAYAAAARIEGIVNSFGDSGAQAVSIFVSQNYGAGNSRRVQEGFRHGLFLLTALGLAASFVMFLSSSACLKLFLGHSNDTAINYGMEYLKLISVFYVLCFIGNNFVGYFRGVGRVMVPFAGTTMHLTLRVILSWVLVPSMGLAGVAAATGAGWILVVSYQIFTKYVLSPPGPGPSRL